MDDKQNVLSEKFTNNDFATKKKTLKLQSNKESRQLGTAVSGVAMQAAVELRLS
jgi:hypothetical protein